MTEVIKLIDVNYQNNGKEILSNINLTVNQGDYLTFSGPSGSGKSTIMKLIANMINPTTGDVEYLGKNVDSYEPTKYRQQVSYCFQQPTLFGETVRDNLEFPFKVRNESINDEQMIERMEMANLSPDMLEQKVIDLSGGQRQRVALLRNLMFLPEVLILDEVTTGLDKENKDIIHNLVNHLNKKHEITVLAITHDQEEIDNSKKMIQVIDGKIGGQ
ncbi:ABC transporter ATP-binding protein [Companilactobacillus sp. RD055328]|uniref:ABC transporter ATP-binding protein n=1 Tax=Companilactobacillus sp. RD055328 TaxID=2916634 RepID=UPI001FC89B78|nr:ATP-binding cassette domain-containing protein [Companilactobacillus sp. RD055328]GKQ42332.1 ABC transporter ATP-binding protein [Companilactobacillus sp. RD055328]